MILLTISCKKDNNKDDNNSKQKPIADFNYSGDGNYAPCTVTFTNKSQNATSFLWDFGDNASSTTDNTTHIYTKGGVFTVRLTAYNTEGENTITKTVNIKAPPTSAYIKKVILSLFPFVDGSGSGWDAFSAPDVYFNIANKNKDVYFNGRNNYHSDVNQSSLPLSWSINPPYFKVPDINSEIYFDIWEYDTPDNDDFIGRCGPFLFKSFTTYPGSISKTINGITVSLEIQWQ